MDYAVAGRHLRPTPAKVFIEACPIPEASDGGILLPESVGYDVQPDVGVVLAVNNRDIVRNGRVVARGSDVQPGDVVLVKRNSGKCMKGWNFPGYTPTGEVRAYGVEGGTQWNNKFFGCEMFSARPISPDDIIMATITDGHIRPTGHKVYFELHKPKEQEGLVLLADVAKKRSPFGTVKAVGPRVEDIKPGDVVLLQEGAVPADVAEYALDESLIIGVVE